MICDRPDWTLQAVLADPLRGIHHRPVVCASLFSPQLRLRVCIEGINDVPRRGNENHIVKMPVVPRYILQIKRLRVDDPIDGKKLRQ
jgi:hypothetical protein